MREIVGIVLMVIAIVAVGFFLIVLLKKVFGVINGSFDPSSDTSMLRYVEHCLSFSCVSLGYTALKWLWIAIDYSANGIQAGNALSSLLVYPAGVIIWLAGIFEEILAIWKICRKDFPRQKLKTASKVILAVNLVLICISAVELVLIFSAAS